MFALAGVTLAGLPTPALARRGRRVWTRGRVLAAGAKGNGPALLREESRSCISLLNAISQGADAIDVWFARFNSEKLLNQYERVVAMQRASLDQSVRIHQEMMQSFSTNLPSINQQAADQNAAVERFNLRCAGKAYFKSDTQAVSTGGRALSHLTHVLRPL